MASISKLILNKWYRRIDLGLWMQGSVTIPLLTVSCPKSLQYRLLMYCSHECCCNLNRDGFPSSQHQSMRSVKSLVLPGPLWPPAVLVFLTSCVTNSRMSHNGSKRQRLMRCKVEEWSLIITLILLGTRVRYFLYLCCRHWKLFPRHYVCAVDVCLWEGVDRNQRCFLTALGSVNNACLVTEEQMWG